MMTQPATLSRPLIPLILAELVTIGIVEAWRHFDPLDDLSYLLIVCPIVCVEGLYSARLIRQQNLYSWDVPKFRAVELIGLGLLVKLSAALSSGNFPANLVALDLRTGLGIVVCLMLWLSMLDTAQDFRNLDVPPVGYTPADYVSPLARLTVRFFGGGVLMLAAMGVLHLERASIAPLIPVVLAYFVLGLLIMPELRFQMSRHRWDSLGISCGEQVVTSWKRAALVLVGLALLIAVLLPTSYLGGLLEFLRSAFLVLSGLVMFVISFLFWLIMLPLRLLTGTANEPNNVAPTLPQLPPLTEQASAAPNPLLALLPKIALLTVVTYIVITYFRDHPELWAMIKRLELVRILHNLWLALRRSWSTVAGRIAISLPSALPALLRRNRAAGQSFRFIRLGGLSAREQLLYFYLSVLRRAHERGIARTPVQTPFEFGETLKPNLPQSQEDLDKLTNAFVEARYSSHSIGATRAKQVESSWKRVKQALRNVRKT
jgi:Domain of unknown function (DUF4129)